MSKHRHDLPQLRGGVFLTDGGMETTLLFHEGVPLPQFAAFPLLETVEGRRTLTRYYEKYLALAAERSLGFLLGTPTWRANPDWGAQLGYDRAALRRINLDSVAFVAALRADWETPALPVAVEGVVGPRGDGYLAGRMSAAEAEDYHAFQIGVFAEAGVDLVTAMTMTTVGEAAGVARAARAAGLPCAVSFTVETDGRLVDGTSLGDAITAADAATDAWPAYYMINCAHPRHIEQALAAGAPWTARLGGLRANASTLSHAELDAAETLDEGDPADLGRRYRALRRDLPGLRVLGGCCGTDHRHVEAIRDACIPVAVG